VYKKHPIIQLIEEGEHQQLDFKFAVNDSKKIARSLSAFANTDGGRLLIGVKDNGKPAGVKSDEEFYMVQAASELHTNPPVEFESHKHSIEGKQILEIIIKKSEKRPHLAPDDKGNMKAFVRVGDQNLLANGVLINVWQNEKNETGVKLEYSDAEKFLLHFLCKNERITFSKFCKLARIEYSYAKKIFTDFILLNIIEIVITDKRIYYKLKDENQINFDLI
jgi:predicted HTH transcriptional regulator